MATPKHIIKKSLIDLKNGKDKKNILNYLKENNYIKESNYRNERMNLYRWERKYKLVNNKLILNKKYMTKISKKRKRYTHKKIKENGSIHFNKTHVFKLIYKNNEYPKTTQCKINGVSYSGYKAWISRGAKTKTPKYDPILLKEIERIYFKYDGIYGRTRIMISLKEEIGLVISRNTVDRYMKHLGLKSVIRKSKYKKERCQ